MPGGRGAVAFVGAGGKTSALFALARELEALGRSVLLTTTTHLSDPRVSPWPQPRFLVMREELEAPCPPGASPAPVPSGAVLVSREAAERGRLQGIHPSWTGPLCSGFDLVLVEADGSRRLPVKAPAPHEPVVPGASALVVGVVGLDALGRPMDGETVHRPERFAEVTGCAPGTSIAWEHLVALARHPEGLFKGARAARAVLLNKADRTSFRPSRQQARELGANAVLATTLEGTVHVEVLSRTEEEDLRCR